MIDHPHIASLAQVADAHPDWRWYCIADSAQNPDLPEALVPGSGQARSLLGATPGSPLAEKSPHLVSLNSPASGGAPWKWIAQRAPRQPCATIVASALGFEPLFAQLQQFAEIRLPDDYDMFFAFWDPAVLGTLIGQPDDDTLHVKGPVFDAGQRRLLFGGLEGWWYWDRMGAMHAIAIDEASPPVRLSAPLALSQDQVDELVEASVPDHVLYFVDLNQPHLLHDIPKRERYAYVKNALAGARDIGLKSMKDMVNYVCMTLIYGARWNTDGTIRQLLARVKSGELRFDGALELLP